jgi:hypothetical protein
VTDGFDPGRPSEAVVVNENAKTARGLTIFCLVLVAGGWLAMRLFVEMVRENRIAIDVIAGVGAALLVWRLIFEVRHPARLEITRDAITQRRKGRTRSTVIGRVTGDLTIDLKATFVGQHATVTPMLWQVGGDGTEIGLATYEQPDVKKACESAGWRFVSPEGSPT